MSGYSSYFNNILTNTTSKYSQLRQKLTNSEADGDTEDDSHISRVLRAYYTEKGGRWPEWLGADPRAPAPQVVQSSGVSNYGGYGQTPGGFVSSAGGGQQPQAAGGGAGGRWGRGGLSDLWDPSGIRGAEAQAEPPSLRARPGMRQAASNNPSPGPERAAVTMGGRFNRSSNEQDSLPAQARPLPSQRAGSYQSQFAPARPGLSDPPSNSGMSTGGGTASDRLKQRFGGGRAGSPTPSTGSGGSGSYGAGANPSYGSRGSNPYDNAQSPAGSHSSRPVVSANAPWSGGADPYAPSSGSSSSSNPYGASSGRNYGQGPGGYGGGPYASSGQGSGLPSGPRPMR